MRLDEGSNQGSLKKVSYVHIDQVHASVVDVVVATPGESGARVGQCDGPP